MYPHIDNNFKDKEKEDLKELIYNKDVDRVLEGFAVLNKFMYDLRLKRLDIYEKYDRTNAENVNKRYGF